MRDLRWVLAGIAIALLFGRWVAGLYGSWTFYHALGADAVWQDQFSGELALRATTFVGVYVFAFANLFAVRQSIVSLVLPQVVGNLEIAEEVAPQRLTILAAVGAFVFALLFALVNHDWTMARLAFAGEPFREFDPYLMRDLGFYVYWLPFEREWHSIAAVLLLLTSLMVVGLYAFTPSIRWDARGLFVSAWVRRHLGILGALAMLLVAWNWRLDLFLLLADRSPAGVLAEARVPFTDFEHRVLIPYLEAAAFLALPSAVVFAWTAWRGYLRFSFTIATAVLVAGPIARLALPLAAGQGGPEARNGIRERPYRSARALFTRRAFGVDAIAGPDTLRLSALPADALLQRLSAWDPAAITRGIGVAHREGAVPALAWQGTAVGLSAIALRAASVDTVPGRSWSQHRLSAASTDGAGALASIPGIAENPPLRGILVAPGAARYAVVDDSSGRLAAAPFESGLDRLLHAWHQQNPRLLFAPAPTLRPRILVHRDVRERLARLVPFFALGPTLTPLVHGDSLFWVVECFAAAEDYPLSARIAFAGRTIHYLQHAATALVHAQTGAVTLYARASPDPVTRSWMARYPTLFTPREAAPDWLRAALPPLFDWAVQQGRLLGRTGFLGEAAVNRTIAPVDDADTDVSSGPATIFQVDDRGTPAWSVPVVDRSNDVVGLLVARGGIAPRTEYHPVAHARRWTTILERLQAAADSAGFGHVRPHARRGRVQAVPVDGRPWYFQSSYEWPVDAPPRLVGIAILAGERTRTGRTLASALGVREVPPSPSLPADALRVQAAALYDDLADALRRGDWPAFGDAWIALGRLLGRRPP